MAIIRSGMNFGDTIVVGRDYDSIDKHTRWICKCKCGRMFSARLDNAKTCIKKCKLCSRRKIRIVNKDGYYERAVSNHPFAHRGYVEEHRIIMEIHIGRFVKPEEIIHHMNGNKLDNRIENLELTTRAEHCKLHSKDIHGTKWKTYKLTTKPTEAQLRSLELGRKVRYK